MRLSIRVLLAATLAAAFVPVPSRAAGLPGQQTLAVSMKDFKFAPASLDVNVGDTVKWTYNESSSDLMPNCESIFLRPPSPVTCPGHSTTQYDPGNPGKPLWDSGVHRADGFPFSYTFTAPGTYHYICTVHGGPNKNNPLTSMEGDIVVHGAVVTGGHLTKVLGRKIKLPATGVPFPLLPGVWLVALGFRLRRI